MAVSLRRSTQRYQRGELRDGLFTSDEHTSFVRRERVNPYAHPKKVGGGGQAQVGLYKILRCFWGLVHESIPFFAHPPFV